MELNHIILNDYPLDKVIPYIDWDGFFRRFGLALPADTAALPRVEAARRDFEKDARRLLTEMAAAAVPKLRGVIRFFPALSHNEEIFLYDPAALDGDGAPRGRPTRPPHEAAAGKNRFVFVPPQCSLTGGAAKPLPRRLYPPSRSRKRSL